MTRPPLTLAQIVAQEEIDDSVYLGNKQGFETLLQNALAMPVCQDRSNMVLMLVGSYNGMADGCKRLQQAARRKENGHDEAQG